MKHADEVLTKVALLNDLAPGFVDEMLEMWTIHFIQQLKRSVIEEMAQKRADEEGFGNEWAAAIEAGNSSGQKNYLANMVALYMKAAGVNQNEAIRAAADQLGRDESNIRRTVTRAKKRVKK